MNHLSKKDLKEQYGNKVIIGGIYCIKCLGSDKLWLRTTTNLQGAKNRFAFSLSTNSCPEPCMRKAWDIFGAAAFFFEPLEEMKKKNTQTEREFADDVDALLELYREKEGALNEKK
jgi:hypothetical protein